MTGVQPQVGRSQASPPPGGTHSVHRLTPIQVPKGRVPFSGGCDSKLSASHITLLPKPPNLTNASASCYERSQAQRSRFLPTPSTGGISGFGFTLRVNKSLLPGSWNEVERGRPKSLPSSRTVYTQAHPPCAVINPSLRWKDKQKWSADEVAHEVLHPQALLAERPVSLGPSLPHVAVDQTPPLQPQSSHTTASVTVALGGLYFHVTPPCRQEAM